MVKIAIENEEIYCFLIHAFQCGCSSKEKNLLYDNLGMEILQAHKKYVVSEDFNSHVGKYSNDYECGHGRFKCGKK